MNSNIRGKAGEAMAAEFLRARGYTILDAGYRSAFGEIDLIAKKRNCVVFVEVKLRKNADFAEAREFVTAAKQRRVITTAQLWLQNNPSEKQPRFDVIEIYGEGDRINRINHIENAFEDV